MHIILTSDKYPPDVGGLAISTRRLALGLANAGHEVRVVLPDPQLPPGSDAVSTDGRVPVSRFGPYRRADDTQAIWFDRLVARAPSGPPDLLHALYVAAPAFVAVAAARYLGVPAVVSARGNDLDRAVFDPSRFAQIIWALQHASAVTAVSRDLARKAAIFAGAQAEVIANGVDAALFSPGPRDDTLAASLGLGSRPAIAFFGEARIKKGLTILLPAFAQVARTRSDPPALLLIGGVRADDEPVLRVFQRQNPDLCIRAIPPLPHDQLPAHYRLADVVAIPSLHDGLPNALLEAMACARPVIASAVGGIPDVLRDGENGLLVPAGDVQALAARLTAMLDDPALCARLAQAARATVLASYTPEREVEANIALYRRVRP
ncbi:MAG: glycosyltransferase [Anaerolineae bacterium]